MTAKDVAPLYAILSAGRARLRVAHRCYPSVRRPGRHARGRFLILSAWL